jgi:hypothetical protein
MSNFESYTFFFWLADVQGELGTRRTPVPNFKQRKHLGLASSHLTRRILLYFNYE